MLRVEEIRYRYNGQQGEFELHIPNFSLEKGKVLFLHGRSGCGKSTLLNLISGVIKSSLVESVKSEFPSIAYVMHESTLLPWQDVGDNISTEEKLRSKLCKRQMFEDICQSFGLPKRILEKKAMRLSLGMRQRVEIAKALAFEPDVLLLDEAFSGIDLNRKAVVLQTVWEMSQDLEIAVVGTAHQIADLLRLAEEIYVLEEGKLVEIIDVHPAVSDRIDLSVHQVHELEIAQKIISME